MQIGEFLVKLGAISDAKEVGKFSEALNKAAKVAAVATTALNGAAAAAFAFFDGSIRKAKELSEQKNTLYKISQKELQQAEEYKNSMSRLGSTLDIVKTKIALGFAPQMTEAVNRMNRFVESNKALISEGITKVVGWLFKFSNGMFSVFKSINQLVTSTIGWKNGLLALVGVLALVNRKMILTFVSNPVMWVIAAVAGLILIIDDLMTYMRGGESYFGKYWKKLDDWAKKSGSSLKEMVEWVMKGAKWIGYLAGIMTGLSVGGKAVKGVSGLFKKLGTNVKNIGKMVAKFAKLFISTLGLIGKAFMFLGRIFLANPILLVIALIAAGAFLIYKNWDKIKTFFSRMWESVTKTFNKAVDAIGKALGKVFDFITYPFRKGWELVSKIFSLWGDDSKSFTDKIKETFKLVTDFITAPFKAAFEGVKKAFDWLMNGVRKGLDEINNSEIAKTVRANPESMSATGGIRGASFVVPPPKSQNQASNNISNQGGDVNATINITSNDPVQAGKQVQRSLTEQSASANRNLAPAGY